MIGTDHLSTDEIGLMTELSTREPMELSLRRLKAKEPDAANNSFELEVGKVVCANRCGARADGFGILGQMGYQDIPDHIRPYLNATLLYLISFSSRARACFCVSDLRC